MNHTSATKGRIMSESLCVYSKIPHFFLISERVRLQCSEIALKWCFWIFRKVLGKNTVADTVISFGSTSKSTDLTFCHLFSLSLCDPVFVLKPFVCVALSLFFACLSLFSPCEDHQGRSQ